MRDGLLVGTEVFVPGQYAVGSGPSADLRLEDASVADTQAFLHFKQGRAAVQESGTGTVFVNGHRVQACEVRSMDEVSIGPFSLKIRVVTQKAQPSAPTAPPPQPQAPAPQPANLAVTVPGRSVVPPAAKPPPAAPPATVVSTTRRPNAPAAQVQPPARPVAAPARPVPVPVAAQEDDSRTESVHLHAPSLISEPSYPTAPIPLPDEDERTTPAGRAPPAQTRAPEKAKPAPPKPRPSVSGTMPLPSIPPADEGKGTPHLFVELYWGELRRFAGSWTTLDKKKGLVGSASDFANVPLWGFKLEGQDFKLAEGQQGTYRVFVPPGAAVERRASDGNFYPADAASMEKGQAGAAITLGTGHALRFSGDDGMTMVAYVQPAIPKPFANPLKGLPWMLLGILALLSTLFGTWIGVYVTFPDQKADFQAKNLNPVAVRLIAPPKKEEKKKIEEKLQKLKKAEKKPEPVTKIEKALPKAVAPETKKALKSLEKLTAAGPALKDLLAAVDKLGSGPGKKDMKSDFKLSGIIGKQPIASAGLGSFGLGGGGAGGNGIKGLEMLRGKGGGGIGALGTGGIGRGSVAGTVAHASARAVAAQGSIDKDAVAKAINSHLAEVSSCYERALLKEPGLAGKIVLEWNISTSGSVTTARTKTSTMKSTAVETCILQSLKGWKFPPAQGAGVVITYPFMFNSVGY